MTLIFSLLWKELFFKPRERMFHLKRTLFVAVGGVTVLGVYVQQLMIKGNKAGLVMFEFLSALVVIAACLVAPFMACNAIVSEKETRTLSLLLMSEISIWQLMLSKLISSIITTFFTVFSMLPLFALCESLGGISFAQVISAFPVLLCTVVSGTCLGLFMSSFLEKELRMQGFVAFAAVVFYILLPAIISFGVLLVGGWPMANRALVVVSPLFAMNAIKSAQDLDLIGWNCLFSVCVGLPLLPLSVYLLPRLYIRPGGGQALLHSLRKRMSGRFFEEKKTVHPPIMGNPVTWKDLHIHYGGEGTSWLRCIGACVCAAAFVVISFLLVAVVPMSPVRFEAVPAIKAALLAVSVLSGVSYLYGAVSRAASCCRREKSNNSLELLLTTDISGYSIIMGKSNAISLTQLPWIITFLISSVAYIAVGILSGNAPVQTVVITTAIVFNLFCMVFAFEYVAIYFSLKLRNFSTATALAAFVAWYVVGNLLLALIAAVLAPFTIMISVLVVPVAGPIMVGNHFRLKLIQEFHTIAVGGS